MHKPLIKSVFATLLTLTLTACWGNDPDTQAEQSAGVIDQAAIDRINATLSGFVDSGGLGASTAQSRVRERDVRLRRGRMAARGASAPRAADTIGQRFSRTTPIARVAILRLYEQGKLDLDDPLARHV